MKNAFDRTVWTVIAAALMLIALNPWIAPGRAKAQSGIMDVNVVSFNGQSLKSRSRMVSMTPLPVVVDLVKYKGEFISVNNPIEVEVQNR